MSQAVTLDRFVYLTLETEVAPFLASRDDEARGQRHADREHTYVPHPSDNVAQKLATLLPRFLFATTILNSPGLYANQFVFAPRLRLLGDVFFSSDISCYRGDAKCHSVERLDPIIAEAYNDFVASFRQIMHARKLLRRELHNWGWSSRQNVTNLNAYLQNLFAQHGSMTVLHLRLSHVKARAGLIAAPVDDQRRDLELLRKSRTRFFDRMRRKPALFTDTPGYVWSIMPLVDGCYELHLTLLFNSAALQKALDDKRLEAELTGAVCEDHADQIGAYWVRIATEGRGSYRRGDWGGLYNPAVWVHGEIHSDDISGREKLSEALGYLALRRTLVRLENEPAGEYFGIPERKTRGSRR